jgi:hypothetical protein
MATLTTHALGALLLGTTIGVAAQAPPAADKPRSPLVIAVGCAKPGSQPTVWTLTDVGERTESPAPALTRAESDQAATRAPGTDTYELIGVADFVGPEASRKIGNRAEILAPERVNTTGKLAAGHKVIVKGLYIAGPTPRINVTSVVDLAPTCP